MRYQRKAESLICRFWYWLLEVFPRVDWLGLLIIGIIVLMVVALGIAGYAETQQNKTFMEECMKDRKEYECVAMWRAGNTHTVVVPIYTGR